MATGKSWSIAVPITKEGGTWGYITVYFQEEYDAVNNYSTLKVTKITGSNTIRVGTFYTVGSISIDGSTWYSWNSNNWCFGFNSVGTSEFVTYSGATYPSGLVINHNDDGSKTINVSVTISNYWGSSPTWYGTGGTVSNSITLTPIPRASTISATDANIEAVSSIAVNRKSSAYTHSIQYQFGSLSGYINADGSVSSSEVKLSATSIGFTIPSSFYAQIPNSKTGICTLTIRTYSGSTQIGDAKTCTFTVTAAQSNCAPSVSGTVVDVNETTLALTGNENKLVRFFSNALATIMATAKNAASIASKVIAGVEVSEDTRTINAVETASFAFSATDSRGYSNSATVTKTLIEYIKLTCNMIVTRDDPTSGKATLIIKGDYFNGSFGAVSNALTVQYRIDGGSWVTVTPTLDGNTYAAIVALTGLDYQSYFDIEVMVTDKLASVTKSQQLNKGIPNYHMGEDNIAFEVDVNARKTLNVAQLKIGGKALWEYFMPVGYIWGSSDPTSPAELYGGTWEQITDRVIVGAGGLYDANTIGGEAAHTLSVSEMPEHSHILNRPPWYTAEIAAGGEIYYSTDKTATSVNAAGGSQWGGLGNTGGGAAHNNMPPYVAKYIWERVE